MRASVVMGTVASVLSEIDPDNAASYAANAEAGQAMLSELTAELEGVLEPVKAVSLVGYHDALQYFVLRFGLEEIGTVTEGELAPSPRHIAEIRELVMEEAPVCVILEPQADPGLGAAVAEGSDAPIVTIDLQGSALDAGAAFYPALLRSMAETLRGCL